MIHPTAVIGPQVLLGDAVEIGPFAVLEGKVSLGDGSVVHSHSIIRGTTTIGRNARIGPAAFVGLDPQHKGYAGQETHLVIGDQVTIREGASIHRSYRTGLEHATRIGNQCYLMGASHVAHDCQLADDVTLANAVLLGGNVSIGSRSFIGGSAGIHQFVRVGRLAIVAGNEGLNRDVPPFAAVRFDGLKGYNAIGVKRAGFSPESVFAIRSAYQKLHSHRNLRDALAAIESQVPLTPEVLELLSFIRSATRGLLPSWRFAAKTDPG